MADQCHKTNKIDAKSFTVVSKEQNIRAYRNTEREQVLSEVELKSQYLFIPLYVAINKGCLNLCGVQAFKNLHL